MGTPQDILKPDTPADEAARPLHPLVRRLCKLITWCERMIDAVCTSEPIGPDDRALIDAAVKPIHLWPPELIEKVMGRCNWSVLQLQRLIEANGYRLTADQILHGIIDAVADADIDLSACRSEADVKRTILENLQKFSRDAGGETSGGGASGGTSGGGDD
jgi:hypothetical protein